MIHKAEASLAAGRAGMNYHYSPLTCGWILTEALCHVAHY